MAGSVGVKVLGLNTLQKRLAEAPGYEANEVRKELRTVAQIVVEDAITHMQSSFVSGSRLDGTLEASLRTSASASKRGMSVSVKEGNAGYGPPKDHTAPYAGWIEFGGDLKPTGKRRGTQHRPFVKQGRFLFPAAKRNTAALIAGIEAALNRMCDTFNIPPGSP
jgi:hypothetical protein